MSAGGDLIVVTGADGFVGTALCAHLLASGRRFRGLVRRLSSATAGRADYFAVGDLAAAREDTLAHALAGATAIVHLAGRAHVMRERDADPARAYHAANVVASERLGEAALRAQVRRFIYVSTIKVNGETTPPGQPFRHDDAPQPQDDYAQSKWDAERALSRLAQGTPLALAILRPPLVYGPFVRGNFLELWRAVARGVPLPLGLIDNRRQLLFVGNLVHAVMALLDAAAPANGTWLIADRDAVSTPDLARRMAAALGRRTLLLPVPGPIIAAAASAAGRSAMVGRVTGWLEIDVAALTERVGPLPFSLDEGLAATAAWWRARSL